MIVKILISSLLVLASANSLADSMYVYKSKDGQVLLTNRSGDFDKFTKTVKTTYYGNGANSVKIAEETRDIPIKKHSTSIKTRTITSDNSAPNTSTTYQSNYNVTPITSTYQPKYQSTNNFPHSVNNQAISNSSGTVQNNHIYSMKNGAYMSTNDEISQVMNNLNAHAKQKEAELASLTSQLYYERQQQTSKNAKSKNSLDKYTIDGVYGNADSLISAFYRSRNAEISEAIKKLEAEAKKKSNTIQPN